MSHHNDSGINPHPQMDAAQIQAAATTPATNSQPLKNGVPSSAYPKTTALSSKVRHRSITAVRSAYRRFRLKLVTYFSQVRKNGQKAARSFVRSVGLKPLVFAAQGERQKVVVSGSRTIAITRAGAHIFPVIITMFLIALNGNVLLNGPPISTAAVFFLQVAAKLHVRIPTLD